MASLTVPEVASNLKQQHPNSSLASTDSGLDLERFQPGSRRNSMLASLRLLAANSTVSERFESRRRGSLDATRRRRSDPIPGINEAEGLGTAHHQHQRARRGSLSVLDAGDAATFEKRTRKRKNLSVPDILEERTEESAMQTSLGIRNARRASSHSGRAGSIPDGGSRGSQTHHAGLETKGGFLAAGNLTSTFRTRLQQARKIRRKKLLLKFKSYSRLVIFIIRLCKNHFLSVDDSGRSHRGQYFKDGEEDELLFDVRYFRAHKEAGISTECKKILSLPSHQRTDKEEYRALIALRNFPTFAEFPLGMQQEIVKVGWYEKYQAQRVILRQGHRPLNFYFIMTGSVMVRVLEEGSDNPRTVVYLNRGETFGELGLVNRERRKSTVISRERVELLCIGDAVSQPIFLSCTITHKTNELLKSLPPLNGSVYSWSDPVG
ncbi:uncharacterized protein LOC119738141 [Patiria miniata]|uniref:Cyclic nucleotide-binding domain-containing protein n=1 Tax=Patiria miniata TaxID=46514 RepID=A0A914AYS6_PATMI|nr:uncharacterized protein LOC119738141 [Patiria miniata]